MDGDQSASRRRGAASVLRPVVADREGGGGSVPDRVGRFEKFESQCKTKFVFTPHPVPAIPTQQSSLHLNPRTDQGTRPQA